ncbi:MAG: EncA/B family entericidin [Mesorhizobium amorphae]|nr:MAG: EncA/B family entericidin [Mesorhizobium amorphae]
MKLSRLAPVALIAFAVLATGCANTIRGAGRDVSNTADATAAAAQDIAE